MPRECVLASLPSSAVVQDGTTREVPPLAHIEYGRKFNYFASVSLA